MQKVTPRHEYEVVHAIHDVALEGTWFQTIRAAMYLALA